MPENFSTPSRNVRTALGESSILAGKTIPKPEQIGRIRDEGISDGSELSEMVSVPRSTLRWRRFVGLGPVYVKIGRSVRYPIDAVRQFIGSNIHVPTTLAAVED
jgi:hypothetical protein